MFWDVFYNVCKEKGTSPNGVCLAIGLSNAVATHWKNGTLPKADVLVKIADYLEVSVDYLLGRTDTPLIKATEVQWEEILDQMSDESRNQLEDYVDFLLWKQDRDVSASK